MKIIGNTGTAAPAVTPAAPASRAQEAPRATPKAGGDLQSAVLQPALAALGQMPEIDQAKVAALREAIARGEIPFDAAKLAGLIQRHHGSRG